MCSFLVSLCVFIVCVLLCSSLVCLCCIPESLCVSAARLRFLVCFLSFPVQVILSFCSCVRFVHYLLNKAHSHLSRGCILGPLSQTPHGLPPQPWQKTYIVMWPSSELESIYEWGPLGKLGTFLTNMFLTCYVLISLFICQYIQYLKYFYCIKKNSEIAYMQ